MLDTDTKRRIDTARDILVGKVPDPKSQVEQITIALIYKFMDDMDAEAEELGSERSFFTGEYARYGWAKLMAPSLGGHEMLGIYGEGIAKMPENPGIPALFRDIFKNAYLPYRDPETLKAFLKLIDEFSYDHSERLGDAFEYLLSVLGSQGDAGQFRTPRHIIDFMVEILAPQKGETILDPACGTAGFLISAYKHIRNANTDAKGNSTLTPDDRTRMAKNFLGYDISPDMVRLSLVNLYLHGFTEPHVYEYDTLTSQDRWNDFADVILANPPFMSPKGGIKPHNRFSIQAKRSEVLFVDYMAEHLTPTGRAAIIVPEGIIFQSQTAYKDLRKLLVENSLVAVVSLPAGVFNPYAGVKTSILILDKSLARQSNTVGFFKVNNDGFGLGAQRRAIEKNDLPTVQTELAVYLQALRSKEGGTDILPVNSTAQIVPKGKIAANGDYNLSGERYREGTQRKTIFPQFPLGEILKLEFGTRITKKDDEGTLFPVYGGGGESFRTDSYTRENDFVISRFAMSRECVRVVPVKFYLLDSGFTFSIASSFAERATKQFVAQVLLNRQDRIYECARGHAQKNIDVDEFKALEIPLPPLEVQEEIVTEIEGYQKVINGARIVLDHYRPHIPINPEWPREIFGEVTSTITPPVKILAGDFSDVGRYPVIDQSQNAIAGRTDDEGTLVDRTSGLVIFGDHTCAVKFIEERFAQGADGIKIIQAGERLEPKFVYFYLLSQPIKQDGYKRHFGKLKESSIAIPPLATQQAIVAEIEAEQALVAANRELITRFEKKIQATLARIWGEAPLEEGPAQSRRAAEGDKEEVEETNLSASASPREKLLPEAPAPPARAIAPKPEPIATPEPIESARPTRPDEMEKSDFMSLLREVLTTHGPCDRDAAIKHAATALGYQRVRGGLAEILSNAIRTAVKRQVIFNERGQFSTGWPSVTDYDKDFLKTQFLAAICEQGRVWIIRDDAIRTFARWLGYRRTGSVIDETARSLINGLLREGRLEKDGDCIRRV